MYQECRSYCSINTWIKVKVYFNFDLEKGLDQSLSILIHIFIYVLLPWLFFCDAENTIYDNFGKGLALDLDFCSWIWIILQLLHKEFLWNSQRTVENAYNMSCFTITGNNMLSKPRKQFVLPSGHQNAKLRIYWNPCRMEINTLWSDYVNYSASTNSFLASPQGKELGQRH